MSLAQCKCGFKAAEIGLRSENLLFCPQCGETINAQGFEDKASLEKGSQELREFIAKLNEESPSVSAPNKEVQGLFNKASKIKHLLEVFIKDEANAANKRLLNDFLGEAENFLSQDEFLEIAFVGTIKAGKSTLINALLKAEYASTHATPETASLTKFQYGEKDEMSVSFYSHDEWDEIFKDAKAGTKFRENYDKLNADSVKAEFIGKATIIEPLNAENLAKYTSAKHPENFFVKEVLISYKGFPYARNIRFVDTPGLDDPVPYRSNITNGYIKDAKVVLMCVLSKALDNNQYLKIQEAFDQTGGHPEKVYVLGTQYDTLNQPKAEWEAQKGVWTENIGSYYTKELADKNIIAVSGYIALLCELYKKGVLDDERFRELKKLCYKIFDNDDIDKNLKALLDFANVDIVHKRINEDILDNLQRIYCEGVQAQLNNLKKDAERFFDDSLGVVSESYEAIGLDKINEQIKTLENELKSLQKDEEEVNAAVSSFESQSKKTLDGLGKEIAKLIKQRA